LAPERFEIVVRPASLDRSGSGSTTGPIWMRHAARDEAPQDFPETNWSDFPVVILAWWLDALAALEGAEVEEATCTFMDGPFEFRVAPAEPTLARVRCFGRGIDADELVADFRASAATLRKAVRAAAAAVLDECDRRGWAGRDVPELRRTLESGNRSGSDLTNR
jgi:hypothetical protein